MFSEQSTTLTFILSSVLVFVFAKLISVWISFRQSARLIDEFPGNKPHWLWGNLGEYPGTNDEGLAFQRKMAKEFPHTVRAWMGPFLPILIVQHPDAVKTILRTTEPKGYRVYNFIRPWVGDGLLLSSGSKWNRNRRLLTPAFHFEILKPYIAIKNEALEIFIKKVKRFAEDNKYFEVSTMVSLMTLDMILRCAFSYRSDCQTTGENHPYIQAIFQLADLATDRFFKPWIHSDFIYFLTSNGRKFRRNCNLVHQVSEDVIQSRKKKLVLEEEDETDQKKCLDFLDILLTAKDEMGKGLSDGEIRDEVDTFLFEGHDTTASALSWTLYSLAEHPKIQKEIQMEVDALLKDRNSDWILWDDLKELKYVTMCIKEAMRLHTPVPFIQREASRELEIDGKKVEKGTPINIVLYNVHHNPAVWEDSMEFRPERFAPENLVGRDAYAFVPFSAGPRNCIGQNFAMHELKIAVARILHRFDLELDPNHKVEKKEDLVMKSPTGIRIKAVLRNVSP